MNWFRRNWFPVVLAAEIIVGSIAIGLKNGWA